MKRAFYFPAFCLILLFSCTKTGGFKDGHGGWQLVQKEYFWSSGIITKPSNDSSVLLVLDSGNTYTSQLNGNVVSQGSYSITTNTSSAGGEQVLHLNNFTTTGIFGLSTFYEVDSSGHVLSVTDGLVMKTSNDTLTLSSEIVAPEGYTIYTFVKN